MSFMVKTFRLFLEILKLDYRIQFCILFYFVISICCIVFIMPGEYSIRLILITVPGVILISHFFLICIPSYAKEQKQAKTFHLAFVNNCWIISTQQADGTWSTQIYISFEATNLTNDPLKLSFDKITKPKIGEVTNPRLLIENPQSKLYGNHYIYPKRTQPGTLEIFIKGNYKIKNRKVITKIFIGDSAGNIQKIKLNLKN